MKLIISIILVVLIALVYFLMSGSSTDQAVNNQELQIDFAKNGSDVKNLEQISHYNAIIDQPLFVEERKFAEEKKEVKVVKPVPVVEDLKVQALGIALTGDGLLAVLKDMKNGKILRMRIGDKIYGWSLNSVSESSFTFSKGGKNKLINFKSQ